MPKQPTPKKGDIWEDTDPRMEGRRVKVEGLGDRGRMPRARPGDRPVRNEPVMQNIQMEVRGHQLAILIDLSKPIGLSSTKKSILLATTGGNAAVEGHPGVFVGVNVYQEKPKRK